MEEILRRIKEEARNYPRASLLPGYGAVTIDFVLPVGVSDDALTKAERAVCTVLPDQLRALLRTWDGPFLFRTIPEGGRADFPVGGVMVHSTDLMIKAGESCLVFDDLEESRLMFAASPDSFSYLLGLDSGAVYRQEECSANVERISDSLAEFLASLLK